MPPILTFALILLFTAYIWHHFSRRKYRRGRLPPGPPPLPIIGNVHQMTVRDPWKRFAEWHERYGPVVCFWVGPFPVIVLSTMEACHELFDKRGKIYSSRPQFPYVKSLFGGLQPFFMSYNTELRKHRQIYRAMLDPKASQSYRPREEAETCRLLYELVSSDESQQSKALERYNPNLASLLAYGERVRDWDWFYRRDRIRQEGLKVMLFGGAAIDVIPALEWLPRRLSPWKTRAHRLFKDNLDLQSMRAKQALHCETPNWTRAVREMKQANSMSWEQFSYTTGELFDGTSLTSSFSLGLFLMTCATQVAATRKAADELESVIGPDRLPGFDDLPSLPYVTAFTKEIMRWRPIAPLGGPHLVTEDDEYAGYWIPANTTVLANTWAIHMDRSSFENPETFRPERWLKNPDVPLATFGFGRRICPGQHVGKDVFEITVARLLWAFEMTPTVDPSTIDTSKSTLPGIVFRGTDVGMKFKVRSARHRRAIERALQD
ncbi:cytochrome P450 [Aspergillus recurvatus]